MQPGDKKALAIIGSVVVAALVIIAVATTLLVRGSEKPLPTVAFQAGDHLSHVEPSFWCSVKMDECEGVGPNGEFNLRIVDHPVPVGGRAVLSVPHDIQSGPWSLVAEYATPNGIQRVSWLHMPDTKYTQVLESTPDRVLLGVEIGPLAAYQEKIPGQQVGGDILYRGVYAIRTLPVDFRIRNDAPLPDQRGK
ncbi:DUF2771 family protein [Gordonia sp. (in: high G+C Gram-positive bacteria)]|uniref:DUF2771 family protein n=1 Tax=Gordonia sp. (in: high G+C Gram-positive bacteria) TaxID=84139 RepID=UPI0016AD67DC|nr:DUF2771 family protein [Gordonia sp. (in: high G+C Gram-positive bacteria)]NLG46859.1 DUF2771 family protein [Gordonia sp. (in: high G+C Gram-positive bacteria)]